jgi:hypothetical protein
MIYGEAATVNASCDEGVDTAQGHCSTIVSTY